MSNMLGMLMSALVLSQRTNSQEVWNAQYTVRQGDTMWRISQRYGVTLDALIAANPQIADPNLIYPGQILNIPGGNPGNNEDNGNYNPDNNNSGYDNNNNETGENGGAETSGNFEEQVVALVNNERTQRGLAPLTMDPRLQEVAGIKSKDMLANNYFSHTSPTYGSPFDMLSQFGVQYSYAGENIAQGQRTPESVVNAWMNSTEHRENILNANFNRIGVGYAQGNGTTYWTQMFTRQ